MSTCNNEILNKQLNFIASNIFRCHVSLELFLYPLESDYPLDIIYEYFFHQQMFLEIFYIQFRKLTEPKNKDRCSIDTICSNISECNYKKFNNIRSVCGQLIKTLHNIREKEEIREIKNIRDCFVHSIPKSLSELKISHNLVLEIKKDLHNITNIMETISNLILDKKISFSAFQPFAQEYAKKFWNTLAIGTSTQNPNFDEYQEKTNKFIEAIKLITQSE